MALSPCPVSVISWSRWDLLNLRSSSMPSDIDQQQKELSFAEQTEKHAKRKGVWRDRWPRRKRSQLCLRRKTETKRNACNHVEIAIEFTYNGDMGNNRACYAADYHFHAARCDHFCEYKSKQLWKSSAMYRGSTVDKARLLMAQSGGIRNLIFKEIKNMCQIPIWFSGWLDKEGRFLLQS